MLDFYAPEKIVKVDALNSQISVLNEIIKVLGEDPVPVMDKVLMPAFVPDNLPQLLQRPVRARVRGHVYMRQSPCPVLDDNKHVEHLEGRSDRNEEVTCENRFRMTLQEC